MKFIVIPYSRVISAVAPVIMINEKLTANDYQFRMQ